MGSYGVSWTCYLTSLSHGSLIFKCLFKKIILKYHFKYHRMHVKHKASALLLEDIKKCLTMTIISVSFASRFPSSVLSTYYSLFPTLTPWKWNKTKQMRLRQTFCLTTWVQRFQKFYLLEICYKQYSFMKVPPELITSALWLTFTWFLIPSMEMVPILQRHFSHPSQSLF